MKIVPLILLIAFQIHASGFDKQHTGVFCTDQKHIITFTAKMEEISTCGHYVSFTDNFQSFAKGWNNKIKELNSTEKVVELIEFVGLSEDFNNTKDFKLDSESISDMKIYEKFLDNYKIRRESNTIKKAVPKTTDTLMAVLAKKEGVVFHWNATEKAYTTPYGIYCNTKIGGKGVIKKFVGYRVKKIRGVSKITKKNVKRVSKILCKDKVFMKKLTKMIRKYYKSTVISKVPGALKDYPQSTKTFLLVAVNSTPKKALSMLKDVTDAHKGIELSDGSLNGLYVQRILQFYAHLAYPRNSMKKPNKKYVQYFLGWVNRASSCLAVK